MDRTIQATRRVPVALLAAAIGLSACASAPVAVHPDGLYAHPIGGAPVTPNPTPYSAALACLADYASQSHIRAPRLAVGRINDMSGKLDENGGRPVTQGAMLMAISALGKAGVPVVERYETDIPRLEYNFANNNLLADDRHRDANGRADYLPVLPGQISTADYFLTGGITELNSQIVARGAGLAVTGKKDRENDLTNAEYVMNIGLDMRLVNTQSLDVVKMVSYQKQIIGRHVGANAFAFFGNNVLHISLEGSAEEPIHLATRSIVERAVAELVAPLYGLEYPRDCSSAGNDPLLPQIVRGYGYDSPPAQTLAARTPAPVYRAPAALPPPQPLPAPRPQPQAAMPPPPPPPPEQYCTPCSPSLSWPGKRAF